MKKQTPDTNHEKAWNTKQPSKTIKNQRKPQKTIENHQKAIKNQQKHLETTRFTQKPLGLPRNHFKTYIYIQREREKYIKYHIMIHHIHIYIYIYTYIQRERCTYQISRIMIRHSMQAPTNLQMHPRPKGSSTRRMDCEHLETS